MNQKTEQKLTNSLILIRIIFAGFLFGITSFLLAMSIIVTPGIQQTESNELFQLIAPIIMVIAVSTSIFLRKAMGAKVHNETDPLKLIKSYTNTRIVQMALMDASILFAIVCFVLTTNLFFVLLSGLGILYFVSLFPLRNKVIVQLKLDNPIGY